MTDLPSSSWIEALEKIALWLLFALVAGFGTTVLLFLWDVGVLRETPGSIKSIIVIAFVIFSFLLGARLLKLFVECVKNKNAANGPKLKRAFSRLSDQQKAFLIDQHHKLSRQFEIQNASQRWLEELENWNFVVYRSPLIIIPGRPHSYEVTERAWLEMDKLKSKGKLK